MALEGDLVDFAVGPHGAVVRLVAVTDQVEAVSSQGQEGIEGAAGRAEIAAAVRAARAAAAPSLLVRCALTGPVMGRGIEAVDEPGMGADGGGDAEREVLCELEGLEVIEHDGLAETVSKRVEGAGEE
jgi:hypothetical protein